MSESLSSAARCWSTGRPPNTLAALPTGRLGRLGGRLMRVLNAAQQREVVDLLPGGGTVLEVGHGPGVLLALLVTCPGVERVIGIDPSGDMRAMAMRSLRAEIAAGRVELKPGDAARTGLADAAADLVVSVNTVAIWPDLDAGVAELHRVLRPGGTVVLSWHGGVRPTRAARGLMLAPTQLARVEDALRVRFTDVRREHTRRCTVFLARG